VPRLSVVNVTIAERHDSCWMDVLMALTVCPL